LHVCVFVSLHVSTTHDGMIFDALQASLLMYEQQFCFGV
jgi:hypothetical protein